MFNPNTNIVANFIFNNKEYPIEHFKIDFGQSVDYKRQPQEETKGGKFMFSILETADDNLYNWAKNSTQRKDGLIKFQSDGITIFEIAFFEAYCISMNCKINSSTGTTTSLVVAPRSVQMNGVTHDNQWRGE